MRTLLLIGIFYFIGWSNACKPSLTEASGTKATRKICSGELIFQDNFMRLDESKWKHENTLSGGGNWEFNWYVNDRNNSYARDGYLHLKPTLTSETFGESFLTSGLVRIPASECTQSNNYGCERKGSTDHIINPIRSARISSVGSFSFKFGTLEIRAKMPAGDYLWPALWLMPKANKFGDWPRSGEIDLAELRGNRKLYDKGVNVGTEQVGSTLHYGPRWDVNGMEKAHFAKNKVPAYSENFHSYKLVWTPSKIEFLIDEENVGTVEANEGFWERGNFQSSGLDNPWIDGTKLSPFDEQFYIILNLAVGGIKYFADNFTYRDKPKPW